MIKVVVGCRRRKNIEVFFLVRHCDHLLFKMQNGQEIGVLSGSLAEWSRFCNGPPNWGLSQNRRSADEVCGQFPSGRVQSWS
jgi:hypothetical protein